MSFLCEVFNFFLNIFVAVVDVIVEALNALITGAITVLGTVADSLLNGAGGMLLPLLLGGALLYFVFTKDEESDNELRSVQT